MLNFAWRVSSLNGRAQACILSLILFQRDLLGVNSLRLDKSDHVISCLIKKIIEFFSLNALNSFIYIQPLKVRAIHRHFSEKGTILWMYGFLLIVVYQVHRSIFCPKFETQRFDVLTIKYLLGMDFANIEKISQWRPKRNKNPIAFSPAARR